MYETYFFELRTSSNPTNRNLLKIARQNQTVTIHSKKHVHTNVFLTMTGAITPESVFVSSCINVYVCVCVYVCLVNVFERLTVLTLEAAHLTTHLR